MFAAGAADVDRLEASGGFEMPVVAALMTATLPVVVINPRQVRDFTKATGQLAKIDTIDAGVLAHFGAAVRPQPRGSRRGTSGAQAPAPAPASAP